MTTRQNRPVQPDNEAVLDPWVADWFAANPMFGTPLPDLSPGVLELARSPIGAPPTREMGKVTDDVVAGVPVRIYEHDAAPTGVVVYFHGGGFCIGSIGLMDHVARELAHCSGATVVSVEYRLAPEHPYPAGLDDCEAVTRWAFANSARLGADPSRVAVAGESAGGNLSAAVALRLRDAPDAQLAAQVLVYPVVDGKDAPYPSRAQFDGIVISAKNRVMYHDAYAGGNDIDRAPSHCRSTPPASPGCRPRSSSSVAATRCATKAARTRSGCASTMSWSRSCAVPVNPTASSTSGSPPRPRRSHTSARSCVRRSTSRTS